MPSTEKPLLSHHEAVQEVYRWTPQIRDYDRFMHIGARWVPYTMYFHEKLFRSPTINTDALGFRYTELDGRRYSVAERPEGGKVNLLVGGSTALGVGSTRDGATVASYLSAITGEVWLNFAGRGYNSTQELLMYLMHQKRLGQIGHVVVLSGINTLALEGIPDAFASEHGRYYYSFEFQHYMNKFNEDMKRKKNTFGAKGGESLLQRWKQALFYDNPADEVITDEGVSLDARLERAALSITDALKQWRLLLAGSGASLSFVLQPLAHWCRERLTAEEEAVFHAIDSCPNNFYRLFSGVLGKEVHAPFLRHIQAHADGIPCLDMNAMLTTSPVFEETLFVDRVHFNDLGNQQLAQLLSDELGLYQEKQHEDSSQTVKSV
ncbi:SGNH/GDSL hydrolase family protein [Pantoea sp. Cy-639]|uniref:SGNH/GDSL hydrolase family protein n=1 Tax=Pantoea sp. Cy-639 TaxID=2608360 RepID=UPI0014236505|nr:SGNH/GDSL hydrolase family protein [Pantoea sp. Cy-639]NIF15572.1 SGNH/GDSL hydrolase family protein [Pantoea sp. Cy-639]